MQAKKKIEMPVWDHLKALRGAFMRSGITLLSFFVVAFFFSDRLMAWLKRPLSLANGHQNLVFLSPAEVFLSDIKIAIFAGLAFSVPVIIYEIWRFIAPGLFQKERRLLYPFLILGSLSFYLGVAFCYFLALPFALQFLVSYGQQKGIIPAISLALYVDFNLKFLFAFGLIFELPVVMAILSRTGVLTVPFLVHHRKYAIVAAFLIAAVLTPTPDLFNQFLMAIPLIILYEIGILGVRFFGKKRMENQDLKEGPHPVQQYMGHVTIAGLSDIGLVRAKNQDLLGLFPEANLVIVADGMSGRPAGEVASRITVDTISESLIRENKSASFLADFASLTQAITNANAKIFETVEKNPDYKGMGSTVVAMLVYPQEVQIGYAGDSRVYFHRHEVLTQITMDHSVANEYFRGGMITQEEVDYHPLKKVISRGIGVEPAITPETFRQEALPGDIFLLCTDGLSNMINEDEIEMLLTKNRDDLSRGVSALINAAKKRGGKDNITVVLIRYEAV
ncbi:MAG: Stp1/IreP family PP2C-type Ser/Thr phosphatase [Nitrospirota bacterium]